MADPPTPGVDCHGDPLPPGALTRLGTLRFRTQDIVVSLAFTPDRRSVVSGSRGAAVVWDATTGKEIRTLGVGLPDPFGPVSLSSDGRHAAVGGWSAETDAGGAVYDFHTGIQLYRFGNQSQNTFARFSPDGSMLATYGTSNDIQLHLAQSGRRGHSLKGHGLPDDSGRSEGIVQVFFTPDTKSLLSAGGDGTIRIWDTTSGKQVRRIAAGPHGIHSLALSPDGTIAASVAWRKSESKEQPGNVEYVAETSVCLWQVATGMELRRIVVPGRPAFIAFAPNGSELVTCGADGVLRVWNQHDGAEIRRIAIRPEASGVIAFSPDGKKFAIAQDEQAFDIRDFATGRVLAQFDGHRSAPYLLALTPDGRLAASVGTDDRILVWDVATGKTMRELKETGDQIGRLVFTPDGKILIATGHEERILAWEVTTGRELYRLARDKDARWGTTLSPDGKLLAWLGKLNAITLIEAASGKIIRKLDVPQGSILGLTFAPDSRNLRALADGERLRTWDLATGKFRDTPCGEMLSSPARCVFSPDGKLVAFDLQQTDFIPLVEVATGRVYNRITIGINGVGNGISGIAFSPDGRTLAWTAYRDGIVRLCEVATGKDRRQIVGHRGGINALAFTAAGTMLVTAGADTTGLVWDLTGPANWGIEVPGPLDAKLFAACWEGLKSDDAGLAYLALRRLIADPGRAVAMLAKRLRPAVAPAKEHVARLVTDLDSDVFEKRDAARLELEKLGDSALAELRQALNLTRSLEVRRRLEQLIAPHAMPPRGEALRAVRAVEALEYIASAEARRLLGVLAAGASGARLIEEARAALARLEGRKD
jgi:WD40 repeat protein